MKSRFTRGVRPIPALVVGVLLLALTHFPGCGGGSGSRGSEPEPGNSDPLSSPTVYTIDPEDGPVSGGEHVTITGENFNVKDPMYVFFGSAQATNVVVLDPRTLTCVTAPHAAGTVHLLVSGKNGHGVLQNAFTYKTDPSILWLDCEQTGDHLEFRWQLSEPGDQVIVCRGTEPIARLEGDVEDYTFTEPELGSIRYTFILVERGRRVDERDVVVDLGRVTWDLPSNGLYGGFYLYVAKAVIPNPYLLLPYHDPSDFSYDAGSVMEVSLRTLYDANLINGKDAFYLAASTYSSQSSSRNISVLSPPVTIEARAILGRP